MNSQEYNVSESGHITDPGKFEGEMFWVPDAYEDSLDGCWEHEFSHGYMVTSVDPGTIESWIGAYDDKISGVLLCEDDSGFVHGELLSPEELADTLAGLEAKEEAEAEENNKYDDDYACENCGSTWH